MENNVEIGILVFLAFQISIPHYFCFVVIVRTEIMEKKAPTAFKTFCINEIHTLLALQTYIYYSESNKNRTLNVN